MEKPLTLRVQETEQKIVEDINNSQLHAYVLKTILEKVYQQLDNIEIEEIKKYNEEQKKESEE